MLLDEFNSNKAKPAGEKPEKVFLDDPFLAIKIILNPDSTHIFCQTRTLGVSVTGGREALLAVESKAVDRSHMATVAGGSAARLGDSRRRFLLVRMRSSSNRKHTTVREHMPSSHRRYADWTPERIRRQAGAIGRHASALVEIILRQRSDQRRL